MDEKPANSAVIESESAPSSSGRKGNGKASAAAKIGAERNGDKANRTKSVIIDRALRMVTKAGIEGLSIGELAKAVGMSKSGLFAHFGGKDKLQLTVLQNATEQFINQVMRPSFKEPRGLPRLQALFTNWQEHLKDPSVLPAGRILIMASIELDDRPGALQDYIRKVQKDLIGNLEKAAQIAIDEGHFRKDLDIEQFAWTMYSFVLGYHYFKRVLDDSKAELHVSRSFESLLAMSKADDLEESRAV